MIWFVYGITDYNSLAFAAHASHGGILLLAVMTLEHAASPPLLDNVLGQEPIDTLVIGPILVQTRAEHETVEMSCTVTILIQGTQLQTTPRSLQSYKTLKHEKYFPIILHTMNDIEMKGHKNEDSVPELF